MELPLLQEPVSQDIAPDYNQFVRTEDEMCLAAMEREARAGRYDGRGQMRAHAAAIAANAATYNSQGACAFARELLAAVPAATRGPQQ